MDKNPSRLVSQAANVNNELVAELERLRREKTELIRQNNELQRRLAGNNAGSGVGSSVAEMRVEMQDMKTTLAEITKKLENMSEMNVQTFEVVQRNSSNAPKATGSAREGNWNPARLNITETILIFGGDGGGVKTDVYMLNFAKNTWEVFAFPGDKIRNCQAAVYLNGEIYFIGSLQECRVLPSRRQANHTTHVCKLTADFNWIELPLTQTNHFGVAKSCVAYNNCLWIIGGTVHDDGSSLYIPFRDTYSLFGNGTSDVEKYDPKTNSWLEMPQLNHPRRDASAIVIGQKIYVCGGNWDDNTVECFDPTSERWIDIGQMPSAGLRHSLVPDGDNFIVLGGYCLETGVLKIKVENGTAIGMPFLPEERANYSAIRFGNTILAIGGHVKSKGNQGDFATAEVTSTVLTYNGTAWKTEGPQLPNPRAEYVSVIIPLVLGNKLKNKFG